MGLKGAYILIWIGTPVQNLSFTEFRSGYHLDELFLLLQMRGHLDFFLRFLSGTNWLIHQIIVIFWIL
ncbi:hypothetical protein Gotri_024097 [Gossypium trilobum]|uniref:Uncharacterized protein n=3 Tax=Gossypium TaxID=3633 RepID=A0A7J9DL89_9ROSI|nr:hypothetical protein [Gossypium davidsonii]MBA0643931.1 hypothetical protein [Gossypium klotzschianum]MBA0761447.1 hypothetical protein [Gossypium trilobum]